jgi:3-oxoacyl-[acyl-carrier-protein] synthase III
MSNIKTNSTCAFRAVIAGTGSCIPEKQLTNEDLTKMVDTSDEWITTRTGIKVRHIAAENETTAMLATEAARKALRQANASAEDVELIIVATVTPEMVFPATACFVQEQLGAKKAWAFDLSAACSGFVYALSIAQHFIISGRYDNVLVIGAETISRITDYKDRKSCILFGDGAGAVLVKRGGLNGSRGIFYSTSGSDGTGWPSLNCPAYGSRYPAGKPLENPNFIYVQINGKEVYQLAVRKIIETIEDCLTNCELTADDIKVFIPHQMNARIIESVAKRLRLPDEKVFMNIDKYGNTSAASIPIALDECIGQGRIKKGDIVLLVAFGGGLTWGANVIEF